jgi:hypothetical protein
MDDICLSPELDGTLGMPTFEHSIDYQDFWEGQFKENGTTVNASWEQNEVPKEAPRYHQEEFSFKGGSTLVPLESINFLAFLQSRGRDFF